jgi:hypothetical protein
MAKSKKFGSFDEDGEIEKVRKPRKPRVTKAKGGRSREEEILTEQLEALAKAEQAPDPIAATQAVIVEEDWKAKIKAQQDAGALPVHKSLVSDADVMDLLSGISFELVAAQEAEEHMAEGRKFKAESKAQMDNVVRPLMAEITALQKEHNVYVLNERQIYEDIRTDLFGNAELSGAIALLKEHPVWGQFTNSMEKRVVAILARDHAKLLADRAAAEEMLKDLEVRCRAEYAKADELGKQGNAAFAVGEEILRANGFKVKERKEVHAHK